MEERKVGMKCRRRDKKGRKEERNIKSGPIVESNRKR
jgi:hypothetical protein